MKIIIADDEKYVRFELKELLLEIRSDLQISEAANGSQLLDGLNNSIFDAAFIDIKMPGFSGLEAIEKVVLRNLNTEWIILTGYSEFEYAKKAINLGVTEYLLKPVSRKELEETLSKVDKNLAHKSGKLIIDESLDGSDSVVQLVRSADRIIRERYSEQIGVSQIADELGITPNYLSTLYRKFTNKTFSRHITNIRLAKALEILKQQGTSVKEASQLLGYSSSRHFARLFREYYNISPSEYIQKYRN